MNPGWYDAIYIQVQNSAPDMQRRYDALAS
ncbi:MAG: hypothetical protein JWM18_4389 [Chloroflexi bacterium]|jgi:hypothetical protein|nr:hypothetical protein [Chloroflexota bacterium]